MSALENAHILSEPLGGAPVVAPANLGGGEMTTNGPVTPNDAAYWWQQAELYDALDAEAVRRGHINWSIKLATIAEERRITARSIEQEART